jgi:mRNA interferase MazF
MVSSRVHQAESDFDEIVQAGDADFAGSGLKVASVIRLARLAVVEGGVLAGAIGNVAPARLAGIRLRLADWIAKGR